MSTVHNVARDERTTVVENTSYRWAYLLLSFALLADVAWRSFYLKESSWDLLALVVAGGVVTTVYQAWHRVLGRAWVVTTLLVVGVAALVAVIMAWLGRAL